MDRFFTLIEKWPNPFGQGLFLLILASMALYSSCYLLYCVTCLLQRREAKPPLRP